MASFMTGLRHQTLITILTIILCIAMSACSRLGHKLVPLDNFNYNKAIARSSNEQMLLNLVRLRYHEVPMFLAVGSVLTQYSYERSINGGILIGKPTAGAADEFIDANVLMRYSEQPTITYTPSSWSGVFTTTVNTYS